MRSTSWLGRGVNVNDAWACRRGDRGALMRRLPLLRRLARHCSSGAGDDLARIASAIPPDRAQFLHHFPRRPRKSTLADRLMELTGATSSDGQAQLLDSLAVERERGITVKAQTVSLLHAADGDAPHLVNLIDTPGHVDFSYEVSRSIGACEGAFLLVDATKGVQAQTVANFGRVRAGPRDHPGGEQGRPAARRRRRHTGADGDGVRRRARRGARHLGEDGAGLRRAARRAGAPRAAAAARADDALRVLLFDSCTTTTAACSASSRWWAARSPSATRSCRRRRGAPTSRCRLS